MMFCMRLRKILGIALVLAVLTAVAGGLSVLNAQDAAGGPPAADPAAQSTADPAAQDDTPSLLHTEVPFGTFLAMAAVLYLLAEPWIQIHFDLPGG